MAICPNCGAENPDGAVRCASCGAALRDDHDRESTIIDVTSGEPAIVTDEPEQPRSGFVTTQVGRVRVYTARSNSPLACIIPLAILILIPICACIGLFAVIDNLFSF